MKRQAKPTATTTPETSVQKGLTNTDRNMRSLRAVIVKAVGPEQSNQIDVDEFKNIDFVIHPPYPLLHLSMLKENSSELGQCVDAMVTNIDGFGYRLVPHKMTDEEKKAIEPALRAEHAQITSFLNNLSFKLDITKLRKTCREDLELTGNAYWELVPYARKAGISSVERMEPNSVRITKLDTEFTEVEVKYYDPVTRKIESRTLKNRFRRYVQMIGGKKVYFKEWGDPRVIDRSDGQVVALDKVAKFPKDKVANPVLHWKIFSNRTPYGLPRYIGNLFSIYGSRSADEINYITFDNNNIPSMIMMVSNGQLTEGSIKRIEEFIETKVKGSSNRSSFLILEAEPMTEDAINPGTMKMEVKDLSNAAKEDQLFQNYDKNNADKIRRCFRLPPIFVGKAEDYSKATADVSRKLADEQVFAPERDEFDKAMDRLLITEFGMAYHSYKSNSAAVTSDEALVNILSNSEKTGGMTPNLARHVLSEVLNVELPQYEKEKVGFDPDIPLSLTLVERSMSWGGNQETTGILAPNQGQIPAAKRRSLLLSGEVEKALIGDIYKELGMTDDRPEN